MNPSKTYRWYFITIYPTDRNMSIRDLEKILFESLYSIRNISEYGLCAISLRSVNRKLKHPHIHILVKTRKSINYRIFLSNLVKKIDRPVSARIYITPNYKTVKRYIDEHEEKYIYTREHILVHEGWYEEAKRLHSGGLVESVGGSIGKKAEIEKPIVARVFNKRAKIGWV